MESNSQAEIGKDIEKASCVEADDSELSHVSKQAGFLFRSATPSNTLLRIKTDIDVEKV